MPKGSSKNVKIPDDWKILLEVFYRFELLGDEPQDVFQEIVKRKKLKENLIKNLKKFIIKLKNSISTIDKMIEESVINWDKERILKIDLTLLRIGIGMFMFNEENPKKIINDILDISRVYSAEDSYRFLNGILDKVAKRLGKL